MNALSNNSALCQLKKFCFDLLNIQLKSDYHVKLSLFRNGECEHPTACHSISGSSKCRVIKVLTAVVAALLFISMLCGIVRCFKLKK